MSHPLATGLPELSFNGIDGTTGERLFTEGADHLATRICRLPRDARQAEELRRWHERMHKDHLDARFDVDPRRLEQTGWGVVFAPNVPPEVRQALQPLLALRQAQAGGVKERYYRELEYQAGESKTRFLARHGAGPGPADPEKLPYYLLLVGGPEDISYPFQYQLDVQYGVGRICFDTAEEYARYAESVVAAETGAVQPVRRATLFGVANEGDDATQRCRSQLILPLLQELRSYTAQAPGERWQIGDVVGTAATKDALAQVLGGELTPGLLFTASHGMGFQPHDSRQRTHQGALLCQDWPGPQAWRGRIPPEHYLCADDVGDSARLAGLITFLFACFGAGTPREDGFDHHCGGERRQLSEQCFVARLPQRLLSHPRGGALAVVGHVDRAWTYSFDWPEAGPQVQVFASAFQRLLAGYPIGAAMEYFGQRYAELSCDLGRQLEQQEYGCEPDLLSLSGMWVASNDARSYAVLGDPAVRLPGAWPAGETTAP